MKNQPTRHHKIAKEAWWTNYGANIEHILRAPHQAHHLLFWNSPPHTQLSTILDRNGRLLNKCFRDDIMSVIYDYNLSEIYHPKCVKMDKMIQFMEEHIIT